VEDQPADSGDLTTTDAKVARRRHRMPLRSELAAGRADTDQAATDDQNLQDTPPEAKVDAEPVAPRGRWRIFGRRTKAAEPEAVPAPTEEVAEPQEPAPTKPAVRTPVGKASRAAKAETVPEPTVEEPTVEELQAEGKPVEEAPSGDGGEAEDASQEEQILVPHRPAGKRLIIAAVAASAVFVAAAAFAGAMLQPYLTDRALVRTKLDVARTATNAITTLWTYTPDNMDTLPDRSAGFLGGDFAGEYRKYIDAIVATNKQAQVTNTTEVMGAAVESVTPTEATALVYTNSVATSPVSKNIPSLRYLSYRLTMQRHDAKWLITHMSTVTSFDLTPQL